ncbi:DUF349 domain-containing protein [Marseilla massiliensis]|uniref:DUF349 domain-containing protein n=1 Tax=Marseilla massiliensis TaxID=1841864 RepID=A0A939B6U6_9BACT|nr:DUF349 domain-containing protein [Marseilla massiliensis]MBM6673091.1 DUF349 domain-containing protein [Marseilla massiliensis]
MDSQEMTLGQERTEEQLNVTPGDNGTVENINTTPTDMAEDIATAAEATTEDQPAGTDAPEQKKVYKNKKEVIARLKEIAHEDDNPKKDEVDYLKTIFYKLHFAEREADMKAYIDGGGDPAEYKVVPDEDEEEFKAEMSVIKEKRAKIFLEQEKEKQENLTRKLDIIEKIKAMLTSPDEANKSYQDFKKLQQEWKEIKLVPAEKANELWRNYQLYVEQYYDLLKLNNEAREYDFKKNLEIKTRLCEAAEKLADESDVISAFHQLQKLHQEYRETGPVAKELREDMWARFKAASTVINKRHQQHFEELRAKEEDNLTKKTELCEKVENIAKDEIKNAGDWDKKTKEIIAIQAEWKTIGFAPQKMNVKIFERFRAACDDFFGKKAEFFKNMKQQFSENIEKKKALVEQAQALQDSTDWKSTSDKLIALQKEWKTIGMVPKKQGDKLWNDFLTACNHFFDARNNANAGTRNEERANLEKKRDIIKQLETLADNPEGNVQEQARELIDQYNAVGHVPFKEKDNVYKEYHDILDRLYKELNVTTARRRLDKFRNNLKNVAEKGSDALDNERARLMRRYESLKQEIQTYENNIGFLSASSKKGNSLIDEMNRKVQKLKDDMNLVREKIKAIDAENNE